MTGMGQKWSIRMGGNFVPLREENMERKKQMELFISLL